MGSTPSGISGSRAAAVLAISKWATPVEVWLKIMEERKPGFCEERGYELPEFVENAAMRWGLAFEESVIDLAAAQMGRKIIDREESYGIDFDFPSWHVKGDKSQTCPLTCHIDGEYAYSQEDASRTLHEGKTTNLRSFYIDWGEPGTDAIPAYYKAQVQHQMMVTGAERCIVSVLVFPKMVDEFENDGHRIVEVEYPTLNEVGYHIEKTCGNIWQTLGTKDFADHLDFMGYFHQYIIDADKTVQADMLEAYQYFWDEHVLNEIPPPARTYNDVKALFPNPKGTVVASDEVIRWSAEYKDLGTEESRIKKRKAEIKGLMIDHVNRYAEHTLDDESVEKLVIRSPEGRKMHTYGKGKKGLVFR